MTSKVANLFDHMKGAREKKKQEALKKKHNLSDSHREADVEEYLPSDGDEDFDEMTSNSNISATSNSSSYGGGRRSGRSRSRRGLASGRFGDDDNNNHRDDGDEYGDEDDGSMSSASVRSEYGPNAEIELDRLDMSQVEGLDSLSEKKKKAVMKKLMKMQAKEERKREKKREKALEKLPKGKEEVDHAHAQGIINSGKYHREPMTVSKQETEYYQHVQELEEQARHKREEEMVGAPKNPFDRNNFRQRQRSLRNVKEAMFVPTTRSRRDTDGGSTSESRSSVRRGKMVAHTDEEYEGDHEWEGDRDVNTSDDELTDGMDRLQVRGRMAPSRSRSSTTGMRVSKAPLTRPASMTTLPKVKQSSIAAAATTSGNSGDASAADAAGGADSKGWPEPPKRRLVIECTQEEYDSQLGVFLASLADMNGNIGQVKGNLETMRNLYKELLTTTSTEKEEEINKRLEELRDENHKLTRNTKISCEEMQRWNKNLKEMEQDPMKRRGMELDVMWRIRNNELNKVSKELVKLISLQHDVISEFEERLKKRTVRQLQIVDPEADPTEIEEALEYGGGKGVTTEVFSDTVMRQRKVNRQTLDLLKERRDDIKRIERSLVELNQMFLDMSILVQAQQEVIDQIQFTTASAIPYLESAVTDLGGTEKIVNSSRMKKILTFVIAGIIIVVIVGVIVGVVALLM